jgi:hypothetical protein
VFLCDGNQLISTGESFTPAVSEGGGPLEPMDGVPILGLGAIAAGIGIAAVAVIVAGERWISRGPRRRRAGTGSGQSPG